MKALLTVCMVLIAAGLHSQVSINTDGSDADSSAMLDIKSTSKGFLPPRMSSTQMNAIVMPHTGLLVYNTTVNSLFWFDGIAWRRFIEDANLHYYQKDIDTVNTTLSGLVKATSGKLTAIADNSSDWDAGFAFRLTGATATSPLTLTLAANGLTGSMTAASASVNGYLKNTDWDAFNRKLTSTLTSGRIFVGNASNAAAEVPVTGDATISNSGVITLAGSGITQGTYGGNGASIPAVSFDVKGRATSANNRSLTPADINALNLNGGTMSGSINMGSARITNLGTPVDPFDAATKQFVDDYAPAFIQNQSVIQQAASLRIGGNGWFQGGNVGIGTTSAPIFRLDVNATSNVLRILTLPATSAITSAMVVDDATGVVFRRQGVFDVTATPPVYSTGGSSPTISLGTVPAGNGGTGLTNYTTGDLLVATSSNSLGKLSDLASGNALLSGGSGTQPYYGKIGLTTHVSGTLPIASGGTNTTTIGPGGQISYSNGTAFAFSATGSPGQALISGGAGSPVWYAPAANSVIFAGAGGVLSQNNQNFSWNNSTLKLFTSSLDVGSPGSSSPFQVASDGHCNATGSASNAAFTAINTSGTGIASTASGIAISAKGQNTSAFDNTINAGGAFKGTGVGVYGEATYSGSGSQYGGYFYTKKTVMENSYCLVGGYTGTTAHTIYGPGYTTMLVPSSDGNLLETFGQVAPEMLMTDYGSGALVNGFCHVDLDERFSYSIISTREHPIKVFIQPEGDCNGVYVTNKTTSGFDVIELRGGRSNVIFSYSVVANRKDRTGNNGEILSRHVGVRFPVSEMSQTYRQ